MKMYGVKVMGYCWWMFLILCTCLLLVTNAQQAMLQYTVTESNNPAILGNVITGAQLSLPSTPEAGIFFTILPITSGNEIFFAVDTNGEFKTVSVIDRDVICPQMELCEINLDIQVNPTAYFQIVKVKVIVLDINDETPTFGKTINTISVSEAILVDTPINLPIATDLDSPENGVVSYRVGNMDETAFRFEDISDSNTEPRIISQKLLDRETVSSYQFLLFAEDSSDTVPHTGSTLIRITLLDVNDSPPQFTEPTYDISVYENEAVNTSIFQVIANDKDADSNAQVYYYFSDVTMATYGNLFAIDETTGFIYVRGALDYESIKEVSLTVIARNIEPTSPSSQAKVIIHVMDRNDEVPTIEVKTGSPIGRINLIENAMLDTFVAHITVQDRDTDAGGQFTCNLTQDQPQQRIQDNFALVQIHSTDFKIVTQRIFDREQQEEYVITINCIDKGDSPLSSSQIMVITITDLNDNTPKFDNIEYDVEITENSVTSGQEGFLLKVHAEDKDIGDNGRITYNLTNGFNSLLVLKHVELNPLSGEIAVIYPFNFETLKVLSFNVSASDHGQVPRSSQCTIYINVLDSDDEGPVFMEHVYTLDVFENNDNDEAIGQVGATDKDSRAYNNISYWFTSLENRNFGGDSMLLNHTYNNFTINTNTGMMYANQSLDREEVSNYTFIIMAIGPGPLYHNSSVIVRINVKDTNDNDPVIIFPSVDNDTVSVPTFLYENEIITQVEAADKDEFENSLLTFHIVSGDDNSLLDIDRNSGKLRTTREFIAEFNYNIELLILVSDNGLPRRSTSTSLHVVFNLEPPVLNVVSDKNQNIVIAIGVLSGFIVVVLVIAILYLLRRKQKPKLSSFKSISETVPYSKASDLHTSTSGIPDVYNAYHNGNNIEQETKDQSQKYSIGVVNDGLNLSDLGEPDQKGYIDQLAAYENRAEPSGGQVKDSSSEGSNADSGRGSHEESTSLPGGGSLQRWDNMQLTLGKNNGEISIDKALNLHLERPHPDPEGIRPQKSHSFRSDSTSPPDLPPRTRRLAHSFRTSGEIPMTSSPPIPPPRLYNGKDLNQFHHIEDNGLYYPSTSSSFRQFDDDNQFQPQYEDRTEKGIPPEYLLYDSPKYIYPQHDLPPLEGEPTQSHLPQTHLAAVKPSHFHLHNEEYVDFVDYNQDYNVNNISPGAMYINAKKLSGAYDSERTNQNMFTDDMFLLDNDVFGHEAGQSGVLPRRTKYCSQV